MINNVGKDFFMSPNIGGKTELEKPATSQTESLGDNPKTQQTTPSFNQSLKQQNNDKSEKVKASKNTSEKRTPAKEDTPQVPARMDTTKSQVKRAPIQNDERAEEKEILESEEFSNLTPKQKVMVDFMVQMQDRLGVKPEQIVQAMADLSEQELSRKPESTTNLVLNKLNLKGDDRKEAALLYQNMLNETAVAEISTQMQQATVTPENVQVLSAKELRERAMSTSLDNMNQRFFVKNQNEKQKLNQDQMAASLAAGMPGMAQEVKPAANQMQEQIVSERKPVSQMMDSFFVNPRNAELPNSPVEAKPLANEQVVVPQQKMESVQPFLQDLKPATLESTNAFDMSAMDGGAQALTLTPPQYGLPKVNESIEDSGLEADGGADMVESFGKTQELTPQDRFNMEKSKDTGSEPKKEKDNDKYKGDSQLVKARGQESHKAFENTLRQDVQPNEQQPVKASAPAASTQFVQNSDNSRSEHIQNIQNIMDRAEVLVTQGGGEMKVQLNPQNLGQVHLKVTVEEGKVNVQMITESEQAKKVLESGMRELKADMAQNNLRLDGLKVDLSHNPSSDFKQGQDQPNMQQDMAREFARNFLGQNREDRQWQREQFLSEPIPRNNSNYAKQRIDDVRTDAPQQSLGAKGKSKRLNVVA